MKQRIVVGFAIGIAMGLGLLLAPAAAQQSGGQAPPQAPPSTPPSAPPTAPPSSIPTPSPTPPGRERPESPRFPEQQERQPFPEIRRPVFLSGRVVLEDGTPPPDSVVIERVCNGVARPEAYTDSKGRFSFEVGRNTMMMADASVGTDPGFSRTGTFGSGTQSGGLGTPGSPQGGVSERELMGCELRASLPGFRSDVVQLSGRRTFDNPDVGTILLRRLANVEGTTISMTSLQAPRNAQRSYQRGRDQMKRERWDRAEKELKQAVQVYPEYAVAWYELGRALENQDKVTEAREAYEKSLAADAKFVSPYLQIAGLAARENNWKEVAETTDRIVRLNPFDYPGAYFFNSVAHYNLRDLDAAEKSAREAVKLDERHQFPKAVHILGVILAQKNQFADAARHMRNYLELVPDAGDADVVKQQLAEVERLINLSQGTQTPQQ